MSAISSYKKQYINASKHLNDDRAQLLRVEQQMVALQQEKEQIQKRIEQGIATKRDKGLLYFSEVKRTELLDKVEGFPYSKQTIQRLRSIDQSQWDSDHIGCDTIEDFEAVERYINDNMPAWEKSPITKIGKWFNRSEQAEE